MTTKPLIRRHSVVWVALPPPVGGAGHEQTGRRPAVTVQEEIPELPTLVIVPLTSQQDALRFPYTLAVNPSAANGLSTLSIALVFQLQVVDRRRIERTAGTLESQYVTALLAVLRQFLGLM